MKKKNKFRKLGNLISIKKVTSLLVSMLIMFLIFITSIAHATEMKLDFITYTIEFDKIESIMITSSESNLTSDSTIKKLNSNNLELAKKIILEINLDEYKVEGLEDYYLHEVESLKSEEGYILNYTLTLPKLENYRSSGSFGSYNGYPMIYTESSYTKTREKLKETNKSKIENFFEGIVTVSMSLAQNYISIPYTLLSTFGDVVHSDSYLRFHAVTKRTNRLISIQDLDNKYGSTSMYIPTYKDQKCSASSYFVFHPNVVGEDPVLSDSTDEIYSATADYYNSSKTRENVYNHYKQTSDGYILQYSVSDPTIDYD